MNSPPASRRRVREPLSSYRSPQPYEPDFIRDQCTKSSVLSFDRRSSKPLRRNISFMNRVSVFAVMRRPNAQRRRNSPTLNSPPVVLSLICCFSAGQHRIQLAHVFYAVFHFCSQTANSINNHHYAGMAPVRILEQSPDRVRLLRRHPEWV